MAVIQILITDDANRRAMASLVEDCHTPVTGSDLQNADLYLVDDESLPEYQAPLEDHKREHAPVFCPVVLVERDRTAVPVDLADPDPDEHPHLVNEVVTAPVDRQTLFRRIANLLVRRRQTTDLREKNVRLERFADTLRHELRNPLNVLDGYLDIARERGDDESFEKCQRAVDQMKRMLEETLLILQHENVEIDRETIELAAVCTECWEMVHGSDAAFECTTTREVYADEHRLRQLFGNLFRNAVEHGESPVNVEVGDVEGGFYVEDDGPGIPEDQRETVFEEGYSTRAGSGLGLSVVRAAVDAHGWQVEITESTTGGARFEVTGVEPVEKDPV